ncbi:class I glutamine amidotransferase-like protein [Mycena belliarum]|uniref:Class I glutamine amidotransferase-like protein n=1 Tax=Mycena belliarum TaxID=1033014 RepID=A0AAD6XI86_9AGAR|nr:class I glutamine amidotransferase-like protein [Mycena belliae]
MPQLISIAVCVSDDVTLSDFIPPVDILSSMNSGDHPVLGVGVPESAYRVTIDYLAPTMAPVVALQGRPAPTFNPTLTYADAMASGKQFDVLWVPAGPVDIFATGVSTIPKDEIAFIAQQAPKAKYVMSVCTGAVQLALAGVLTGKRATTSKAFYHAVGAVTPKDITWVPEARWVIDGNVWTSSGVAAGADMALAFVEHLAGKDVARYIRNVTEHPEVTDKDDPFAKIHGLI